MSIYTSIKSLVATLVIFIISSQAFGQAVNLDQIRNGPATDPSKNFWDNFDNPEHVNGNAGSSNAHYVEGHSISYRSLVTLLVVGRQYEYVIEYDTKHSDKMALDYLTHFQRLLPHGQFNHNAEIIYPRIMETGSKEYLFTGDSSTFAIPAPFQAPANTPVAGFPQNSFNALPASPERLMTVYRGTISNITYDAQQSLTTSATSSTTRVRIKFTANSDSVLFAWGGHIASRLDWGFIGTTPRSAGGISGSPYHMRSINIKDLQTNAVISLGNTDRSLSAAAVIPPPDCPTVPSQTICAGGSFGTFTIASPQSGTTYTWSFGTNSAGAVFTGGGTTATGNSVTVVKSGGGTFTSGSFTLNIVAVRNGISQTCNGVASGTVEVVVVTASADPTSIDITSSAHNTTLTADIGATSTDANNANYSYVWSINTAGVVGTLSNATSRIATWTAAPQDAGKTIEFKVIATQNDDPNSPECSDDATVSVTLNSVGACDVSPSNAVCAGTEVTHTGSPDPKPSTATYTWSLTGFGGSGNTSSTLVGANGGTSIKVNATQSYRIILTQVYQNTAFNTSCFEDVSVTATPSVSATYVGPACDETTFKVNVTSPTIGFEYDISQPGNSINYTPITPTAGSPNVQFTGLVQGDGWTVTVKTGGPGCTGSTSCETNPAPISQNSVVDPNSALSADKKKANDLNKISDVADSYSITLPSGTKVKSLPNPYTDKVRFNIVSGVSGLAVLELHNVLGQKVGVVYQGYIKAGTEISKEYYVPSRDRGTLIYTFRVGDQKVSGKLVPLR